MDTDRLSSLPDEVICQILSFLLRTKPSVQTSVLSKRWRFLWTLVPFLGFNYVDTRRADIITKIVLQQHKHSIHTFRVAIHEDKIEEEFRSWIVSITTRNIRKLDIVYQGPFIKLNLPQCLFTCRTLVDLSLLGCGDIPMSGIHFPALKKLGLHCVRFKSHESLVHLISGCPVLDELRILRGMLGGRCCVSSPTLTKLVLELYHVDLTFGVNLDTPALRYLQLLSYNPDELSIGALDSLNEADMYSPNVLAFVGKLRNVKLLTLAIAERPGIRDSAVFALDIKFHNLTKLILRAAHLGFVAFFLENANNLRVLEFTILFKGCIDNDNDNEYGWKEPEQVPPCLLSHLQMVELDLSLLGGFERVLDMVTYILVNAKVLKRMKVPNRWLYEKKLEETFKKEVALFERGSQECELVFY